MRFRMRFFMVCVILSALFAAPLPGAWASDDDNAAHALKALDDITRKTLVGLQSVNVLVRNFGDATTIARAGNDGLTKNMLQTSVELSLRKAGIRVATNDELVNSMGSSGVLDVNVNLLSLPSGAYVFSCQLSLMQLTYVCRNSVCTIAPTWISGGSGTAIDGNAYFGEIGYARLAPKMQEIVSTLADQFCNAYLAANPKK